MSNSFAALTEELSKIVQEDFLSWPQIGEGRDVALYERPACAQDGYVCLLVSSVKRVPFEVMTNSRRPENLELVCSASTNAGVLDAEVVKVYAPGDCLVKARVKSTPKDSLFALMSHSAASIPVLRFGTAGYVRVLRRCDFPSPGMVHILWGRVGTGDDESLEQGDRGPIASRISRGHACMCDVIEPLDNGESTRTNFFTFVPAEHKWMISATATTWIAGSGAPRHFADFACQDDVGSPYVVLRIKKCSRGPPLLYFSGEETDQFPGRVMKLNRARWTQSAAHGAFDLCSFLQRLLRQVGLTDFAEDVFDSLDGRRLVFFQAAVRADAWCQIESAVKIFFSNHSAAYRHWYGGRAAPALQIGTFPIFQPGHLMPQPAVELDFPAEGTRDLRWSCKNTFIHFDDGDGEGDGDVPLVGIRHRGSALNLQLSLLSIRPTMNAASTCA